LKGLYGDLLHVITVYVIEPHPNGARSPYNKGNGWQEWWQTPYKASIDPQGNALFQPRTFKERVGQAKNMIRQKGITTPVLIDEMDNPYWSTYGYMPNCGYLISQDGYVFERQSWFARKSPTNNSVDSTAIKTAINTLLGVSR
jgi:hypothetical protein